MNIILKIPAGTKYWYDRTDEQINNLRALDAAMGETLDSAGEPKIYNRTTWSLLKEASVVSVIKTRGVTWTSWVKKPSYLIEVLATIDGVPRIIKVRDPRRVLK